MSKEIGGYMELEAFHGKEMYGDLYRLNLGRTSLVWLLENIEHDRIFIPAYICDSVPSTAARAGFKVVLYGLDENLDPVWGSDGEPGEKDILYLVNYYGQLSADKIRRFRDSYQGVIVDNAQAFYDAPVEGVYTLYTARKYFGLSDGAYVAAGATGIAGAMGPTTAADTIDSMGNTHAVNMAGLSAAYDLLPDDCSAGRISHLTGRLEGSARDHYSEMLAVSDTFASEIPRKMSPLTVNLLRGIDYDYVKNARCANYRTLSQLLPGSTGSNPFIRLMPECPFAYPYYHEDGPALRKYLAGMNIFVPTNWSYLINTMPEGTLEHEWSANILPLPVDQRYGEAEMQVIAEAIRSYK